MDQLLAIRVFVEVVERGSFAAAANALSISRNMASRHVADLEAHLSARLLNRTTRSLSLTSAGQAYFDKAREILGRIKEADAEAGLQSVTPSGRISISAPMSFGIRHLSPYLPFYLNDHPRVSVDLALNDRMVDLVEEGFDIAIRVAELADSSLIARKLADVKLLACASPAYVEQNGMPREPADIRSHQCVGYTLGVKREVWNLTGPHGSEAVRISPQVWTNNGDAIEEMVLAGAGIALQPEFIVNSDIAAGRVVDVLPGWTGGTLGVYAVYTDRRFTPVAVRSLIDWLVTLYRPVPPWHNLNIAG